MKYLALLTGRSTTGHVKHFSVLLSCTIAIILTAEMAASGASFTVASGTTDTTAKTLSAGQTGTVQLSGTLSISGSTVAITVTGNSTITNSGTILQTGTGRAIRDNTGGLTLTVTNNAGALIQTANNDVIQMNVGTSNVTFNNYGTLTSLNPLAGGAQAIDFNAITTGSNVLKNYSSGLIQATEADAVRPGVNGFVNNDGTIKSTTTTGSSSDGIDAQTNSGITIVNAAGISGTNTGTNLIEGGRHGITGGAVVPGTGTYTMSITNNAGGTIQGDNGSGINIDGFNANELVTIINHGTITGSGVTGDGDGVDVDGLVNLTNTGLIKSIKAFNDNSEGVTVGGGTIINSGTIEGDNINGGLGRGITLAGLDKDPVTDLPIPTEGIFANTSVDNSALIKGQTDSGIAVTGAATAFTITITNRATGTIEGGGATAVALQMGGDNDTVINYGLIKADSSNLAIDLGAGTNSLQILGGSASIIGNTSGGVGGTSSLTINPGAGNSFSYGYVFSNFNTVGVQNGTVTLSGTNLYTGTTTLSGGTLAVGNQQALGLGSVAITGGTLTMANGNQTLTIGGTFTQNSAGTLALALLSNTTADQVNVAGTAHIGGSLAVNFNGLPTLTTPGTRFASYSYTLLTSTGLTGTYTLVPTNEPANDTASLAYTPQDVILNATTQAILFPTAGLGLNSNQQATLAPINNNLVAANPNADFATVDTALANLYASNASAFPAALDQLSPEKFERFTSATAFNNASFEAQAMASYLAGLRGQNGSFLAGSDGIDASGLTINDPNVDPSLSLVHSRLLAWNPGSLSAGLMSDSANPVLAGVDMKDSKDMKTISSPAYTDPWNFFVRGSVILAQGFSQAGVPHFDDNTESVVLGTDYRINQNFLVGLTAGYAHTDATLDNNGSSATVDSYSPGFYASYADHGWYANLSGEYLHNAYTQDRAIAFLGQTAHSAPEGNQGVANLDGGYDFHQGALTFGPLVGIQYTHLSVDGFSESGSAADLNVGSNDSDSLRSRLGGTLSYAFNQHGMAITPHLNASWQHEFLDQSRGITSQFGFGGGSFAVNTPNPSRESALADAGVTADLNRTVSVFADYIVQAGQDNYFGQSVQAGVKIGF